MGSTSRVALAVAVAASVAIGALPILTPPPPDGLDAAEALVLELASVPHPMGSAELAVVRDRLVVEIEGLGLEPVLQTVDAPDWFGTPGATVEVTNVMTRIEGTGDGPAVVLSAHYDSVPSTPGANDNMAAVAALLVTADRLTVGPPPNDVIVLFTDGEEPQPRFGASAFAEHPWFADVGLAANFEGIGSGGPSVLVEVSGEPGELVPMLVASSDRPVVYSFMTATAELIGGAASDFDVFRDNDVPGLNFAYLRGPSIYHTGRDQPSSLNMGGMGHHADLATGIARAGGPGSGDAEVFFTLPGWVVVTYGPGVAAASAVLAVLVAGTALVRFLRAGSIGFGGLAAGFGLALATVIGLVLVGTLLWMAIAAWRPEPDPLEGYLWLGALASGTVLGWWGIAGRGGAWPDRLGAGVLVLWMLLAGATGFWLPAMSALFVWPTLLAGAVMFLRPISARIGAIVLVSAVVLVPAVDTFAQLAMPRPGNPDSDLAPVMAVPLLLVLLAAGLAIVGRSGVRARR